MTYEKDEALRGSGMLEGGEAITPLDQAWWQIRNWVEDRMAHYGWHRHRLAGVSYTPLTQVNRLLGGDGAKWPNPRYVDRLLAVFGEDPPPHVMDAARLVNGEPVQTPSCGQSGEEPALLPPEDRIIRSCEDFAIWLTQAMAFAVKTDHQIANEAALPAFRVGRWRKGRFVIAEFPTAENVEAIARVCGVKAPEVDLWGAVDDEDDVPGVAGEIKALSARLAALAYPKESAPRNAQIFAARYTSTEPAEATLQAIATPLGMTRERVRQIVDKMLSRLPMVRPRRDAFDRLTAAVARAAPIGESRADKEFQDLLGPGMGLAAALRYGSAVLGADLPFRWRDRTGADRALVATDEPDWWKTARGIARRMVRIRGAAHLPTVFMETWRAGGEGVTPGALTDALSSADGFEWLDEGSWFWFGVQETTNSALGMAEDILRSSPGRVDIEVIHGGVLRSRQRPSAGEGIRSVEMPASILRTLLVRCGRFACIQTDDFEMLEGVEGSVVDEEDPAETVAETVVAELERQGGVAAKIELTAALVDGGAVNPISLSVALASSPMITQLQRGVYAIRGWPIDPERLGEAVGKVGGEAKTSRSLKVDADRRWISWEVPITTAMLGRSVIYLPSAADGMVKPGVYTGPGGVELDVSERRIAGVAKVMRSMRAQAGDVLVVEVDLAGKEVRLSTAPLDEGPGD